MSSYITVSSTGDIAPAIGLVRTHLEKRKDARHSTICCLLSEELLQHLLNAGYTGIRLRFHGAMFPHVEITAQGEEDHFDTGSGAAKQDRIGSEINLNLLNRYADHLDFVYSRGMNRYRVYYSREPEPDLQQEISGYYAQEDAEKKKLGVLLALIKNHKARMIFTVINRSVKHLAALMLPVLASSIIDLLVSTGVFLQPRIILYVLLSFACIGLNLTCFWLDCVVYHRFTRAVESGFKMALVQKSQILSMRYYGNARTGTLLSKLISDVQFIQTLLFDRFTDVLHLSIDIVFVIVTALLRFPPMLIFYVIMVPATILLVRSFSKPVLRSRTSMRRKTEQSNDSFKEMLEMREMTRVHALEKKQYRDISSRVRSVQRAANLYDRINVYVNNVSYGGFQAFRVVCLCVAGYLASKGYFSIGTVVLFQSIFDMIINSLQKVLDTIPDMTQGYDSLMSVNEILQETSVEKSGSQKLPGPIRGEIELKDVRFRYDPDQKPVLDGVSLTVPEKTTVALIGKSGEGKTTLMNLMLGLYEKESGSLTIDGVDIDELDKSSYRSQIAVVPQNTILFSSTLWDNLVYGLSYVSEKQVMDVLESVGLDDYVSRQPEGLDSPIHEGGLNLSGGQRQRIAIARALLRNAKIVFFDEATSALDQSSEELVQKAIDAVIGRCTVVMIAHRLNTLRKADAVYRVEDGKLTLCGPGKSLTE